ncbi:hypothetical protein SNE32_17950, partial [Lysobacter sp. D1-1-M9]|uniref:hypothetical protein n=1 Tax=Novilysobacter longmucuonensis TaxID=3098603 RepID=UPI002FCC2FD9
AAAEGAAFATPGWFRIRDSETLGPQAAGHAFHHIFCRPGEVLGDYRVFAGTSAISGKLAGLVQNDQFEWNLQPRGVGGRSSRRSSLLCVRLGSILLSRFLIRT